MPYSAAFSERFLSDVKSLDGHQRKMIYKRIEKILQNPQLGKSLHAPLNHYFSERIEVFRIIYKVSGETVEFAWLDHRDAVYK